MKKLEIKTSDEVWESYADSVRGEKWVSVESMNKRLQEIYLKEPRVEQEREIKKLQAELKRDTYDERK